MRLKCDHCGSEIRKKPSAVKKENYCNKECRANAKHVTGNCAECGKAVRRLRCATKGVVNLMCSRKCFNAWNSKRFTDMNIELNPDRMVFSTRAKLRNSHLGKGEGKTYTKTFSRHTHRVVAEQKIGRPLKKGEVVHHIDEDKRNNHPDNLIVFPSQADHARWHKVLPQIIADFGNA